MPNPVRLSSLTIAGLRGVLQELVLEFRKPMTLVYGENSTGKTSICDALDFIGNGKCGSLDDISVGHGKHLHWPHIGQRAADVNVRLSATDGTIWTASIINESSEVEEELIQQLLQLEGGLSRLLKGGIQAVDKFEDGHHRGHRGLQAAQALGGCAPAAPAKRPYQSALVWRLSALIL